MLVSILDALSWVFGHIKEIGIAILILIFLLILRRSSKRKAAIRAYQRQQEEIARRAEEEKRKAEEEERKREAEIARSISEREARIQAAIDANPGSDQYRLNYQRKEVNYETLNITQFTSVSKKRFVAFDLETTGIDPASDQIVEIGAVRVVDGQIVDTFEQLIDPGCRMPAEASAVNHITDDMVCGKPYIYEVLPAFLNFIGDDVLAAHNARFDISFVAQNCMLYKFKAPERVFDTMLLARYYPEAGSRKLIRLCEAAGIELDGAHRALADAKAVAELILATNDLREKK